LNRIAKIVVVCEGWRDSAFIRGFLKQAHVSSRSLDVRPNPRGSGHDWVAARFAEEVANLERFSEGRGVLGLLDEDGQGASTRVQKVAGQLLMKGLPQIDCNEGRCLLLPTRNLETWLYWLKAQSSGAALAVSESSDYKRMPPANAGRLDDSDCGPAGMFLHSINHTNPPPGCPPMLVRALESLRAFLNAVRR
jgi:hypothetical protein